MDFGLLGPLVVRDGTRYVPVSAPRQRVLLAALLLRAGRVVGLDALAEVLWEGQPPAGARGALHSAVQRLRSTLGPSGAGLVETRPPGYLIRVDDGEFDVREFSVLAARGHAAAATGTWAQAARLLREALGLWRGDPLADVPSQLLRDREAAPIEDQRRQALAARIDADLHLGRHGEVVAELRQLVTAHPLQEQFHAQLMLSLYRSGRPADALAAYQDVRRVLAGELGIDPGPELRLLHQRILAADSELLLPAGLDAQAGLYRSLLAGQRMLVLLDNARDVDQVRPLLPAGAGCLVIVTSRSQLTSLVAAEGAAPLTLGVLTEAEARELLSRCLGPERVAGEPSAAGEVIQLCARLPLALSIAAARTASQPGLSLAALTADLRDARRRLDALDAGHAAANVRAVLSWSYHQLDAPAARLFRLLGLHPGPDISAAAAASLAALPLDEGRRRLGELTRAHLLAEHPGGRFWCHDLLRAYAAELTQLADSAAGRRAATGRMLDHYLHTAHSAALRLHPPAGRSRWPRPSRARSRSTSVPPGRPWPGSGPRTGC